MSSDGILLVDKRGAHLPARGGTQGCSGPGWTGNRCLVLTQSMGLQEKPPPSELSIISRSIMQPTNAIADDRGMHVCVRIGLQCADPVLQRHDMIYSAYRGWPLNNLVSHWTCRRTCVICARIHWSSGSCNNASKKRDLFLKAYGNMGPGHWVLLRWWYAAQRIWTEIPISMHIFSAEKHQECLENTFSYQKNAAKYSEEKSN
jgi:hypothetical protein